MQIETDYTQIYLFPPSIEEWVPKEHPVRFIREFVDSMDLIEYGFKDQSNKEGRPSYSSNLLLKIWLYNYYEKIYSTRQIEKACQTHLPLIWLTTMNTPDHNTIWRFFKENKSRIKKVFKQTVQLAVKNDMVGFVLQAVDGTKIKADVSREKTINKEDLEKILKIVEESIEKTNSEIEKQREEEQENPNSQLPKNLQSRSELKKIIKEGLEQLREEEKRSLKEYCEENLELLEEKNRKVLSITDKESRLIKSNGRKDFYYNVQSIVDSKDQIIVGSIATNEETDNHLITKMIEEGKTNSGKAAKETLGDRGYFSGEEIKRAEELSFSILVNLPENLSHKESGYKKEDFSYQEERDCYICPKNHELNYSGSYKARKGKKNIKAYKCGQYKKCPERIKCGSIKSGRKIERYEFEGALSRQREKQKDKENQILLAKRREIVETVFAWIKHNGNFQRWLYRGLESVEAQWLLLCSSVNLRKLYRVWSKKELIWS